jgi:hypothetical protein
MNELAGYLADVGFDALSWSGCLPARKDGAGLELVAGVATI